MRLDIIGSQKQAISVAIANQVSENCYVVPAMNGRNQIALVGTPGSRKVVEIDGACRGINLMGGIPYGVWGSRLYKISSDLSAAQVGSISGSSRVSMATDGENLVIVTGAGQPGYIYNKTNGSVGLITDPDFPGADTVGYVNGYFFFSTSGGRWFICELGDPLNYNALDFVTNEKSPDQTLALVEDHGEVFCFGEETIEVWFNSGNADFPFERNGSAQIERGIYARFSVAKDDNTLFFLGDDLMVYRLEGYTPAVISDDGTAAELSKYLASGREQNLRAAFGYSYSDHGHKFYVLTIPGLGTHVYDVRTQQWHKRAFWGAATHHSAAYVMAFGKHLFGGLDGSLYEMRKDIYSDDGSPLKRLRRTSIYSNDGRLMHFKRIKWVMDVGRGVPVGQGAAPVMGVRWSDNNGLTWSAERLIGLGAQGDYACQPTTRSLGSSRGRMLEFYVTDPVPFVVTDCYAIIT